MEIQGLTILARTLTKQIQNTVIRYLSPPQTTTSAPAAPQSR